MGAVERFTILDVAMLTISVDNLRYYSVHDEFFRILWLKKIVFAVSTGAVRRFWCDFCRLYLPCSGLKSGRGWPSAAMGRSYTLQSGY